MAHVYVTDSNPYRQKFHRSEDCTQLTKRPAKGVPQEIRQIDIQDVGDALPCLRCYPDAPRAKSLHKYCHTCDTGMIRPCAHNGGVKVLMTRTRRVQTLLQEPGEQYVQERWVWPERASRYVMV